MEDTEMTNWFTSDTHYYHSNIILYSDRPFHLPSDVGPDNRWKSKEQGRVRAAEMTSSLVKKHNALVDRNDTVYHLGDFTFGGTAQVISLLRILHGNFKFIWGNHDKALKDFRTIIDSYADLRDRVEFLGNMAEIEVENQGIVLNHYAMKTWNRSHRSNWHLYGHSHGTLPDDPHTLSFDVGVDCHNYEPITFSQVKAIMAKKLFKPIDHHGERLEGGGHGLTKEDYAKADRKRMYEQLKKEFS